MEASDIKIDKDGVWYYRGAHMFRKEILCTFFEHLKLDECGQYFIELNNEVYYLDVEDTAFVILSVSKTTAPDGGHEQIEILLSDDCIEKLDLNSLFIGCDNVMYCRIKSGKFTARFTRNSYYQLAEVIGQDDADQQFYIFLNNRKYLIKNS